MGDNKISFYIDDVEVDAIVQHYAKTPRHELININTDSNLVAPEAYRDLYVYHVLAQIASKESDSAAYESYKNDYNSCLIECLNVLQRTQLMPNLLIKD